MKFFEIIPQGTKIDFVRFAKYAIPVSAVLVTLSLVSFLVKGFNWGIDFAGGLETKVEFIGSAKNTTIGDLRNAMDVITPKLGLSGVQVNSFMIPGKNSYTIKAKGEGNINKVGGEGALQDLASKLLKELDAKFGDGNVKVISTDMVGPRVGSSLRKQGIYAIIYSMIGILIYVGVRFDFRYGPGGVISLLHDIIIVAGIFSLLGKEMNLLIIAALLTLAGYSINDTIVVFDRIREGRAGRYRNLKLADAINRAINETLSRTVLTSGVTLLVVIALYILGGEILRDFAFALLFGIVFGTYSSIVIASPLYLALENMTANFRKKKKARR